LGFRIHDSIQDLNETFGAITLIEVIEHMSDPVSTLRYVRHLLHQEGKLFLTTPCGQRESGIRNTNAYDTPEHVQFFTQKSLELCAVRAGFRSIQLERISELYPYHNWKDRLKSEVFGRVDDFRHGYSHLTGFFS